MKVNEIKKIVEQNGLEFQIGNNYPNVMMEIWWPFRNSGLIIDGKIYNNETLTKEDVERNHEAFQNVIDFLYSNNIQVDKIFHIEFNFVSNIVVTLRNDRNNLLDNKEHKTNFDVYETQEDTKSIREFDYFAGVKVYNMFDDTLKKHEKDKVMGNMTELMYAHNANGRQQILTNLAMFSGFLEPMKFAAENNLIDISHLIELILTDDRIYYQNEEQSKKLCALLSKYPTTLKLDLTQNRGYLPDAVVENSRIAKQVFTNWKFVPETEQRILTMMLQNEQFDSVKAMINNYPPFQADDFYDNISEFLIYMDDKMIKEFLDNWCELNNHYADFIDELPTLVVRMSAKSLRYAVEKVYGPNPNHLYTNLVDAFSSSNAYSELENAQLLEIFIDNPEVDLTYRNGYIVIVFQDNEKIKEKLFKIDGMIEAVIVGGYEKLVPESIKDIFLF